MLEKTKQQKYKYYKENHEKINKWRREYYQCRVEHFKAYARKYRKKTYWDLKEKILNKYGSKCIQCGFDDLRALQIDHVNGDGKDERKYHGSSFYLKMILKDMTGKYQILCANCNIIKSYKNFGRKIIK